LTCTGLASALRWYIAPRMARNPDGDHEGREWGRGSNVAWSIIGTLFAGMIAWGGIGWLIDRATGSNLFLPFGILLGVGGALYVIVKRYGS
jgi:ATP synthase protein I